MNYRLGTTSDARYTHTNLLLVDTPNNNGLFMIRQYETFPISEYFSWLFRNGLAFLSVLLRLLTTEAISQLLWLLTCTIVSTLHQGFPFQTIKEQFSFLKRKSFQHVSVQRCFQCLFSNHFVFYRDFEVHINPSKLKWSSFFIKSPVCSEPSEIKLISIIMRFIFKV